MSNIKEIDARFLQTVLPSLIIFQKVAQSKNFAKAAKEMGVTPTAISKSVKLLEEQLNVRLFNRNTRSVALTEQGAELLKKVIPSFEQIKSSLEQITLKPDTPAGHLRISASQISYAILIEPHLKKFLTKYPSIITEISLDNKLVDIIEKGFDAGIRLGESIHKDMIALPVGPIQFAVAVASPKYIKKHGRPSYPKDLLNHNCIRQRFSPSGDLFEWEFKVNGKNTVIDITGNLIVDDMSLAIKQAKEGNGIAYTFKNFALAEIEAGNLEIVCEKNELQLGQFYIYYPNRKQTQDKLKVFTEYIRSQNWNIPGQKLL